MTPRERRDNPRRVADRSVAMRRGGGSSGMGWLWLALAIAGGVGGATYYYSRRGFAPFAEAVGDSTAVPGLPIHPDSAPAAPPSAGSDSAGAQPQPTAKDTAPSAQPVRPSPTSRPTPRPPAPAAAPVVASADSGDVRLVGLPRGSTVMIDERPALDPVSRLSAGKHVLAVSAPRFQFFTDTITVRAGDTLELTPALLPVGAPAQTASKPPAATPPAEPAQPVDRCSPGPGYNATSCFDERPKPVEPPFVPLPAGIEVTPRPSQLWVKVSAEGRTVDIKRLRPSDDAQFEQAARDFAWIVAWHPAMKDGTPVEAWTQMLFPPQPQ